MLLEEAGAAWFDPGPELLSSGKTTTSPISTLSHWTVLWLQGRVGTGWRGMETPSMREKEGLQVDVVL